MNLIGNGNNWRIEGSGKERARIAYATEEDGRLVLTLQGEVDEKTHSVNLSKEP